MGCKVLIKAAYDQPDIFRQMPSSSNKWNGVEFVSSAERADYLIVLNPYTKEDIKIETLTGKKWMITQEPPDKSNAYFEFYFKYFDKILTQFSCENCYSSQPALPWHVDKNFDELKAINLKRGDKSKTLSWITSNKNIIEGHSKRMEFMDRIKEKSLEIDIFGKGINPISDKWDGLFPYKYTLAVENFSCRDYWTEKIADAYLSWCMPIYYGCTNISEYFPEDSYIQIDINKPDEAVKIINEAIENNLWEKNLQAVEEARNLILDKYQLFPFLYEKIMEDQKNNPSDGKREKAIIPAKPGGRMKHFLTRLKTKI